MISMSEQEFAAWKLADRAHAGQKYNNLPYIEHPGRVVKYLLDQEQTDPDVLTVAWLHDVVEDCPGYTIELIRERFGDRIGDAVDAISRRKGKKYLNGKESEDSYLARVRANEIARIVKFADMIDNLMMTGSTTSPDDKKKLWRKYTNACAYLSGEERAFTVVLQPVYTDAEYKEMSDDRYFEEEYD